MDRRGDRSEANTNREAKITLQKPFAGRASTDAPLRTMIVRMKKLTAMIQSQWNKRERLKQRYNLKANGMVLQATFQTAVSNKNSKKEEEAAKEQKKQQKTLF